MTSADKLRELLATRPTTGSFNDLLSWWVSGAALVTELLGEHDELFEICQAQHEGLARGLEWPPTHNKCGWCVSAAGDDQVAADSLPTFTLDEVREHTATCPGNPLVKHARELQAHLDGRIRWQVSVLEHIRIFRTLFDSAVAMREIHEGCVTEPSCGDCVRCRFDSAVDEASRAASTLAAGGDQEPVSW